MGTAEWESWKITRHADVTSGWLTVCGLFWLQGPEGTTYSIGTLESDAVKLPALPDIPPSVGSLAIEGDFVTIRSSTFIKVHGAIIPPAPTLAIPLAHDGHGAPTVVGIGEDVTFFIIKRSNGLGVRVKNKNSEKVANFKGLEYFPYNPDAVITAKFAPHDKVIRVPNVLGATVEYVSPGSLTFTWQGASYSVDPVNEAGKLWFIFKDATSTKETYAMRFLYAELPQNGEVVLDFNYAYSPACMFTEFAACPLPPKQNVLPFPIEAGEKKYDGLH